MTNIRKTVYRVAGVAALIASTFTVATAQGDSSDREIFQNGVKVADVYIAPRAHNQKFYVEHFVLYPNYVYPGAQQIMKTKMVRSATKHRNATDFLQSTAQRPGYRYVELITENPKTLPWQ